MKKVAISFFPIIFAGYFFINSTSLSEPQDTFDNVYNYDPFDKNCLIRMDMCSYGFKN